MLPPEPRSLLKHRVLLRRLTNGVQRRVEPVPRFYICVEVAVRPAVAEEPRRVPPAGRALERDPQVRDVEHAVVVDVEQLKIVERLLRSESSSRWRIRWANGRRGHLSSSRSGFSSASVEAANSAAAVMLRGQPMPSKAFNERFNEPH